jgi:uncharacterized spore protein YtfJ
MEMNMDLIDREKLIKTIPSEDMVARMAVMSAQVVNAISIERIEKYISEIKDDVPDVASAVKGFIEIWKEEQEKENENS